MLNKNQTPEVKQAITSSLITCIYIPLIVSFLCYNEMIYVVGKYNSLYIIAVIFAAECLKLLYLSSNEQTYSRAKKPKNSVVKEFCKTILFTVSCILIYFVGIILFGAPFLSQHEETLMLATLLAVITIFPITKYIGIDATIHYLSGLKGFNGDALTNMFMRNIALTLCGAWAGAIVIPLDWDRVWQVWPVPCYLGTFGGYLAANMITIVKHIFAPSFRFKFY